MKTWMKYILASLLLLLGCPLSVPAADGAGGTLTVDGSEVDVALNLPEGKTEMITSLRLWLYVTVDSGNSKEPAFAFNSSIPSRVKSADIQKSGSGYLVDLILSGKSGQDIFGGQETVSLGSLTLASADGKDFSATVGIAGENGAVGSDARPVVKYVNSSGTETLTIPLSGGSPAQVKSKTDTPDTSKPDTSNPDTSKPDTSKPELDCQTQPSFMALTVSGTPEVRFAWDAVSGADGYEIEQYDAGQKKYRPFAVVPGGNTLSYKQKMSYGEDYTFRLRAYAEAKTGKLYGSYSAEVKVKTLPAAVKSFSVQFSNTKQVAIVWKKTTGAEGYKIYRSTKKNGKYTLLKTVKKGSTVKLTGINHKDGKVYYYKIRAYRTGIDGKQLQGKLSSPVRATVAAPKVTGKAKGSWITLKWKKVARADGYVIYKYNEKTNKYKSVAQVYGQNNTSYAYKLSAGKSLDFKVRAYEKQKNKSRVYGNYSAAVQHTTAPAKPSKVAVQSANEAQATVSWKKTGGATGYQVYRSMKKSGSYKRVKTLTGNSKVKYVDKELVSGKTYYYKVRAYRTGANNKKVYGKFGSIVRVKVK